MLTQESITQDVKSSVAAYLMARTFAEVTRERVEKIQRAVLEECPLRVDPEWIDRKIWTSDAEITDPKDTYLAVREDFLDYLQECNKRERAENIKPANMLDEHCPALVAENVQTKAEHLIVDSAAEMLGLDMDGQEFLSRLLCKGLDEYERFIDLVVKLVVNHPDFESPMMQIRQ